MSNWRLGWRFIKRIDDTPALCGRGVPATAQGCKSKGPFSFAKENGPFGTPRERLRLAVQSLNDLCASGMKLPARGKAALALRYDLPLLLLSAAALPIL